MLISVPIEIGLVGLIKYILKRYVLRYSLPVNCNDFHYFKALLLGYDISRYRLPADGFGSHFGFDYRSLDTNVKELFSGARIVTWNKGTMHFIKIYVN